MNSSEKTQCSCGGQYRWSDKSKHLKTNRHVKHIAGLRTPIEVPIETLETPIEVPIETLEVPVEVPIETPTVEEILKYVNMLTSADRDRLLNMIQNKPAPDEEDEYMLYLELKERDPKSIEEIEIYLKHHEIHGCLLDDYQKDFLRASMLEYLNNGTSRFT